MAVGAAITESARMPVVDRMTRDAVCRRLLVSGSYMAADTACRLMFPDQAEFRFVVIESIRLPTRLIVTAAAIRRKGAIVCIALAVTIDAVRGCVAASDLGQMTSLAWRALVRTGEWVVGQLVIEGGFAESSNVGVSSPVFGMTGAALAVRRERTPRVQALAGFEVGGELFVTGETQPALGRDIERLVTRRTITLVFLVSLGQRTRHHQLFQIDRVRFARGREENREHRQGRAKPEGPARPEARHRVREPRLAVTHVAHRGSALPPVQYRWTATTWIAAEMNRIAVRGTWIACHSANSFSNRRSSRPRQRRLKYSATVSRIGVETT